MKLWSVGGTLRGLLAEYISCWITLVLLRSTSAIGSWIVLSRQVWLPDSLHSLYRQVRWEKQPRGSSYRGDDSDGRRISRTRLQDKLRIQYTELPFREDGLATCSINAFYATLLGISLRRLCITYVRLIPASRVWSYRGSKGINKFTGAGNGESKRCIGAINL